MKILVAGGGTGGHIYPGLTIARTLLERDPSNQIVFVGTTRGLEGKIIPREGFDIKFVRSAPLVRRLSPELLRAALTASLGIMDSFSIIRSFSPDVVLCTGGYAAGPVAFAAALARIPIVIQEQNAIPGVTNRLISLFASAIALGYPEAAERFPRANRIRRRILVAGNPVRREFAGVDRREAFARLGLDPNRQTLLILGASQGASSINKAALRAMDLFKSRSNLQVVLQTGSRGFDEVSQNLSGRRIRRDERGNIRCENFVITPYIYDMPSALAVADLVVGRAGAISIAEITAVGVPAILVPYPHASENHQEKNARALERAGAAIVILESDLEGYSLASEVLNILDKPDRMARMRKASRSLGKPEARDAVADLIYRVARRR